MFPTLLEGRLLGVALLERRARGSLRVLVRRELLADGLRVSRTLAREGLLVRRLGVGEGPVGLVLLGRGLGDGLLTQSNFFFFGRLDALVVRGRVRLTFQSRVISVKSRPGALLGRLEPRDLRRRVVDGLLELLASLGR